MRAAKRASFLAVWILAIAFHSGCAQNDAKDESRPMTGPIAGPAGRLQVDDGGEGGVPVVFAHSFAGSGKHWSAQLEHLRSTRRAIALDLRGHGESEAPPTGAYAVDSLAADIAAVVEGLGLDRFVLVGHSMGGSAAVAYAGAHPDRVAGLVLVGTPGKTPLEQSTQILASLQADYDSVAGKYWNSLLTGARPDVEAQVRSEMQSVPRAASLAMIGALFAFDPLPSLRAYPGPKLLVDTAHDESPGGLHHLAPEVPRQVIAGTSHWPQMDKPEEFNRILDEVLATVK
ncbi:MAG TPA: alpha/beta hydrolase [Candidatus Limnocylindria bacterium]|nr:alpha/beta hydrolase [Candidatus Limnocylindria bacterium]